jgi:two-component system chemotaxis response regulator CheB
VKDANPRRFRCHTGHGFSLRALQHAQGTEADEALWSAMRALQEKQLLLESLAETAGDAERARRIAEEAERVRGHGATLRRLIESLPSPPE